MVLRILFSTLLLVSACALPVWLTLALALIGLVLFHNLYELVPIFFIHDVLYGVSLARYFHFPYVMTLAALGALVLSTWLRGIFFRN